MEKLRMNLSLDLHWIKWLEKMQERTLSHTSSETVRKIFCEYQKLLEKQDQEEIDHQLKGFKNAKIVR